MYQRLRDLREDHDLNQTEVANYLHCDPSLDSKYERGERAIPTSAVIKLAELYHTSTDYILGVSDNPKK